MQDHFSGPQDARADADQSHAAAGAEVLQQVQLVAKVIEIHGYGPHTMAFGDLLHGLEEVAAGDHRAVAGVLEHRLQFLHRNDLDRGIQVGGELLGDQHGGADVLPRGADQHPGAAAQPPVDLTGQELPGRLQGAAAVQQAIHALPDLAVDVRKVPSTGTRRRLDFPRVLLISDVNARAGHGLHHAVVFQLPVDLADGVAMQAGLHRQLARTG